MLASCLESWVVTFTVRFSVALLMCQTFANRSVVTLYGFSAYEALKKAAVTSSNNSQSPISSKGVVLLKIVGDSNISQSCGLVFVLPTAAANFDRAKRSFNLSTNNSGYKVVLILATCAQIVSVTTDLSIDGGKYSTTAYEEITASTTLLYADTIAYFIMMNITFSSVTCSTMLSRGSALTSSTSIGSNTYLSF